MAVVFVDSLILCTIGEDLSLIHSDLTDYFETLISIYSAQCIAVHALRRVDHFAVPVV